MVELIVDEEIKKAYRPVEEEPLPEEAELDLDSDFVNKSLDDELSEPVAEPSENSQSVDDLYVQIEYFPSESEAQEPAVSEESQNVSSSFEPLGPREYFAQALHEENEILFVVDLFDKLMCGYGKSWLKPKFLE
jgi:hypothetical protein